MTAADRRRVILEALSTDKFTTRANLAFEFGVSSLTSTFVCSSVRYLPSNRKLSMIWIPPPLPGMDHALIAFARSDQTAVRILTRCVCK